MLNKYFGQGNHNIVKLHGAKQTMTEKQLAVGHLNDSHDLDIKNFAGHLKIFKPLPSMFT